MEPTRQGRRELARGLRLQARGPAGDAYATLSLASTLLRAHPEQALAARVAAAGAAWSAGDHAACVDALEAGARLARALPPGDVRDYTDGMLAVLTQRADHAAAPLARALGRGSDSTDPETLLRAVAAALLLGDVETACRTGARALAVARARDDEDLVSRATELVASAELRAGRHALAREHALRGLRAAARTGRANAAAHHHAVLALVGSVEGPPEQVARHVAAALEVGRRHGLAQPVTLAEWAAGRSALAAGRAAEAATRLRVLLTPGPAGAHFALRGLVLPTYVEASAAADDLGDARGVLDEMVAWAAASADPQAAALLLRCRALMAVRDAEADALFERAHAAHRTVRGDFERARTLLLHGKWLRRRRRAVDARERLRDALHLFDRCGAAPWSTSARTELRAAGARQAAAPPPGVLDRLTPHQQRIARCVAAGDTNREVAERLSVSVRTIDHHLRNIFGTLQVRSRVELSRLVPAEDAVHA
ncbi:helix-turn-helix transcriptional regulator [Isoptericola sp. NEAU-Y5]|uniref:Helix-turn-helix transcriptional regulator n=1 Tax=Isoptericola luteus TaxID=2879484 RepID=A0ABS7ZIM4_9MICO|nr:helix-turn-helix transcriptional regulator [Isoptericola sp. NEAU-Y5]MCA5893645.1 helix-turn-helix transcriptional regulator [Isoptericola sp. NEAU-Y5]